MSERHMQRDKSKEALRGMKTTRESVREACGSEKGTILRRVGGG